MKFKLFLMIPQKYRFLEDGDLHTDYKRERQFNWAGLDDRIEVVLVSWCICYCGEIEF